MLFLFPLTFQTYNYFLFYFTNIIPFLLLTFYTYSYNSFTWNNIYFLFLKLGYQKRYFLILGDITLLLLTHYIPYLLLPSIVARKSFLIFDIRFDTFIFMFYYFYLSYFIHTLDIMAIIHTFMPGNIMGSLYLLLGHIFTSFILLDFFFFLFSILVVTLEI